MNKEQLKRIFSFIEEKEGQIHKDKGTFKWKLAFNEPLTKEDLNVKGDLDISNIEITSLPEGLKIQGDLFLYYSMVELPKGLKIGGNLHTSNTIYDLPKGLKLGGDLYLSGRGHDFFDIEERIIKIIHPGFIKGQVIYDEYDGNEYDEDDY